MLALAGMSLAAGAMIGVGPAQAAPAAAQPTGSGTSGQAQSPSLDRDYIVGSFRFQQACRRAGWTGIRRGAWEDYRCFPLRQGWRGLVWVLEVEEDDWSWNEWRGDWPGGWPDRPDYVGRPFHIRGHGDRDRWHDGPRGDRDDWRDGPRGDGPRGDGPRGDGPRGDGPRGDGPRGDGPRGDGPRGDWDDDKKGPGGNGGPGNWGGGDKKDRGN